MIWPKDYFTQNVVTVSADASIDNAIGLFKQHDVRHLPVKRDGSLVGMVSTGDVLETVGGLLSEQRASTQDASVAYAGPTEIEQIMTKDVVTVSHRDAVKDMIARGRDLEKVVLGRAIKHHVERKILVFDNRTVVFS